MLARGGFARLSACEVPEPVDVGVRAQPSRARRLANVAASTWRALGYAVTGRALAGTERVYYRRGGS